MACPTCSHTMHALGCRVTDRTFFWCPRCGTTRTCDGTDAVPDLVRRCREFEGQLSSPLTTHEHDWHRLGIGEAINPTGDRPTG